MSDPLSILVIDDKRIIGDLFDFTLGYSGHLITVTDREKTAIEALREQSFDIVFLDIVMPDKDGIEILKEIKEIAPRIPVVVMTGYSVTDKKNQALKLGAVACLKKPFEIDDVKKIIRATLGKDI